MSRIELTRCDGCGREIDGEPRFKIETGEWVPLTEALPVMHADSVICLAQIAAKIAAGRGGVAEEPGYAR